MTDMQLVQWIFTVFGSVFLLALLVGFLTTGARVIHYLLNHKARPRLLTRDVLTKGGLLLSFAPIVLIRFLPAETRQAITTGNVTWALLTTVPATLGMCVYVYYEIFVIERAGR
jgi:hypothetical protein